MRAFLRNTLIASLATMTVVPPASALVTLGHGRLVGTAGVRVDYDSNIFVSNPEINPATGLRRSKRDVDDYIATATAELRYVRDAGVVTFDAGAGVNALGFANHSDQNTLDPYLDARLGYAPTDKTDARVALSYRRNSIANEQVNVRTESNDLQLDGQIQHLPSEKLGFRVTGSVLNNDYTTPGYSDIQSYTLGLYAVHAYSPKLKLLAGVAASDWSTDAPTARNSIDTTDWRYSVSAEGELSPKVNGEVSVGYTQRNSDTVGLKDTGALYLNSRVAWTAAEKTIFTLNAGQNLTLSAANQSVRAFLTSLAVNHTLTEKLAFSGSVGYERSNYTGAALLGSGSRRDTAYTLRARLSYALSDATSADVSTGYRDSNSTSAISDYERFNFGAGVSVRF